MYAFLKAYVFQYENVIVDCKSVSLYFIYYVVSSRSNIYILCIFFVFIWFFFSKGNCKY